jgi:hypothetical protein
MSALRATMPKTAIDEYCHFEKRKIEIWISR